MANKVEVGAKAVLGETSKERGVEVREGLGPPVAAEVLQAGSDAALAVWRELAGLRDSENKGSSVVGFEGFQGLGVRVWLPIIDLINRLRYPPPIGG